MLRQSSQVHFEFLTNGCILFQEKNLVLYVVGGKGPTLIGQNWLEHIRLDWKKIGKLNIVPAAVNLESLLANHAEIFIDELGTIQPFTASLQVQADATPKYFRPRTVPFALKHIIETELERLESCGILEKVDHSNWAAPIVVMPKKDGKVRICGDYKVTVNQALDIDHYPLPKPEHL